METTGKQIAVDVKDVKLALTIEEGLSDWEVYFLDSINRFVTSGTLLSDKQRRKLNEILQEHNL